jgi:MFS family permease
MPGGTLAGVTSPTPPPAEARRPGLRDAARALQERDFAVFWTGALLSNIGGWVQRTTIPFVIFEMTGSASWVGLAIFLQFLPAVALGPLGGSLADRHSRRSMLMATQSGMAVLAVVLFGVFAVGTESPVLVVALVSITGVLGGLNMPAWQSFVTELVPRHLLLNAITLNSAQFNGAKAIGPAAAGIILATGGPAAAFAFNAVSYAAVLIALALIAPRPAAGAGRPRPRLWPELGDTVRYVRARPGIVVAIKLVLVLGLTGGVVFNFVKVFADDVFHVGDTAFGALSAAIGTGAILGAPIIAGWGSGQPRSRLAYASTVAYGMGVAAFALAPTAWIGGAALMVVGAAHLALASTLNTTIQLLVDDHMRGKVMSLYLMGLTVSVPVGSLVQGLFVDWAGPRPTVLVAGLLLAGAGLWHGVHRRSLGAMDDGEIDGTEEPRVVTPFPEPGIAPTGGG